MTPDSPEPFPDDVRRFLLEFSIAVHRHAIYPPGHPTLRPVAAAVARRLGPVLAVRGRLALGVGPSTFTCDGAETDPGHPVLSELAARLHHHEVGGLTFEPGVGPGDLRSLLAALAADVGRGGAPLGERLRSGGAAPGNGVPEWEHVTVVPLEFEELALREDAAAQEALAEGLWDGLVRSLLPAHEEGPPPDAEEVAERVADAIRARVGDDAELSAIATQLSPLLDALGRVGEGRLAGLRKGVSQLLTSLEPDARTRLLSAGGDARWRRQLLGAASRSLDLHAMLDLLDAAAESSGQTISTSMTRLLTKLAAHGKGRPPGEREAAEGMVRDNVRALLRDWSLADPNPDEYTRLLDGLARRGAGSDAREDPGELLDIARRVVAMSLEIESWTARADEALLQLLDAGRADEAFELLDALPEADAARRLAQRLRSPAMIRRVAGSPRLATAALDRMIADAGNAAIAPLLDGLAAARGREERRAIFDRLAAFGPALVPEIRRRLPGTHWTITRNLLALLQLVPGGGGVDPGPYLAHPDPRVRRTALGVALGDPSSVEPALLAALADPDERVVREAVLAARHHRTPAVESALARSVIAAPRSPELRALGVQALGIRALGSTRAPGVREGLLALVAEFVGRPPQPREVEALSRARAALRAGWPGDAEVRLALLTAAAPPDLPSAGEEGP